MDRREFIGRSLAAIALLYGLKGFSLDKAVAAAKKTKANRIGIQLYSVKDELEKDFSGSLRRLSDIGFASAETYGFDANQFHGRRLKEVAAMLADLGMTLSGSHGGSGVLPADTGAPEWDYWKKGSAEILAAGGKRFIQAGLPEPSTMDDLKRLAEHYNRIGEVCRREGAMFGHHNHHAEFKKIDGQIIYDYLIENTDPGLVFFQMDMCHTTSAGADCVAYIKKYPGRFSSWHAADYKAGVGNVEVGKGDVDFDALFKLAKKAGLQDLSIEQEAGADRFGSCRIGFNNLAKYRWTKAKGKSAISSDAYSGATAAE